MDDLAEQNRRNRGDLPKPRYNRGRIMEFKRLITHFTYRIEAKRDGGFIARASDPTLPPLEAPTRFELNQKIEANINSALAAEFPGLKMPLENKALNFAFHIEHKPDGSLALHSNDGQESPVGGSQSEIENRFAEKFAGLLEKHLMPGMLQAFSSQLGSGDVNVTVRRGVNFSRALPSPTINDADSMQAGEAEIAKALDAMNGSPITRAGDAGSKIFRFLVALLAIAGLMFFYLHRHR